MIDTVIFDFDGTVMNTNKIVMMSWQHTFKELTGEYADEKMILSTFGEALTDTMKKFFPDVPQEKAISTYRDFHRERFADNIELFPGILEMLRKLKTQGYKIGMATSRLRRTTVIGMEKFGLTELFDEFVTVEEVEGKKPEPDTLLKVLEKLDSKPENAIMVGDARVDLLCAHNGGSKAVLVGWSETLAGKSQEDFNEAERPEYIISTADELFDVLEAENN